MIGIILFRNPVRFSRLRNLFIRGLLKIVGFYGALLKACNSIVKSNNLRWFTHQPPPPSPSTLHSFFKTRSYFLKIKFIPYIFPFYPSIFSFLFSFSFFALKKIIILTLIITRVTVYLINTRRIPRDPAWLRWII